VRSLSSASDKQRIADAFHLGRLPEGFVLAPDYSVAPATFQPVIRLARETGEREIVMMRWGGTTLQVLGWPAC
jgi:putative SOS response-associated peptidase YedK